MTRNRILTIETPCTLTAAHSLYMAPDNACRTLPSSWAPRAPPCLSGGWWGVRCVRAGRDLFVWSGGNNDLGRPDLTTGQVTGDGGGLTRIDQGHGWSEYIYTIWGH